MKKKLTALCCLLVGAAFAFGGCTTPHTAHVDENEDGKCDVCGEEMSAPKPPHTAHVDENEDGKCDECGEEMPAPKPPHTTHVDENEDGKCNECGEEMPAPPPVEEPFAVTYRAGYTPTKFTSSGEPEITELGDGVHLVKNTVKKSNGQTSVVWTVEVDLNKANIVAGTKNNRSADFDFSHATPYQTAQAWEKETGGHVYSSLNADFFNQFSANGVCVNAFVKDGIIIKDGHNDNGKYDYKDTDSDVPASAPMLFGVSGTTAQIAPIVKDDGDPTQSSVKEKFVKAKFTYALIDNGKTYDVRSNATPSADYISLRTEGSVNMSLGYAVKVDTSSMPDYRVLEVAKVEGRTPFEAKDGIGWLLCKSTSSDGAAYLSKLKAGDTVSFSVSSPDGTWDGYETILGCRQALVIDDQIASTLGKENSNGAQSPDVPRSAVGLKDDHTVVIFAVESLHYYGKNAQKSDPHGMNLPELAEFAYYYGCTQAANFDGGGSTQLVVRGEEETAGRVIVRSADTGTNGLNDTRPVLNAILVTSRKEA